MTTTCTGVITALSCVETGVPVGSWRYTVTPVHNGWTGGESTFGSSVSVGAATVVFSSSTTVPAASLPVALAGTVANFLSAEALSFRLDSPTGLALSATPAAVGADGSATISVTIPAGTDDAPHSVFAVGAGRTTASAAFAILAPPVLSSLLMLDVNANGKVDRAVATLSKPLATPYTAGVGPWTVARPTASLTLNESTAANTAVGSWLVALTVGPTCARTGCASLGTATAATNVSGLLDATLSDAAGVVPTTVARNISARLF